jgi:hypothetical protein
MDVRTNVPDMAMSFSDIPFAYGPFVPHYVPKQYIENYFSAHRTDGLLVTNTTVEDVSRSPAGRERWTLTLRQHDAVDGVDRWWTDEFDAVVLANGHYSVPFVNSPHSLDHPSLTVKQVPPVKGLDEYISTFPGRVLHSKSYRSARVFADKKVLVIGNSASGHDVTAALVETAALPVYQSRRSASRWDGDRPEAGIAWKPTVREYRATGEIVFDDGSVVSDVDAVIYCTGYKASFPFWNAKANGAPLFDYAQDHLVASYQHVFLTDFPTVGVVGIPRTLTFRSFEYQAIALARVFSGRNARPLPSKEEQRRWDKRRWELVSRQRRKYHDIPWDNGETMDYLRELYELAGLPRIEGAGRYPPILEEKTRWAIENVKKYPEPENDKQSNHARKQSWTVVERGEWRDNLHFI